MTIQELKRLAHGTVVIWDDCKDTGRVVRLSKRKPNDPRLHGGSYVYIQWPDGQRTDASDDWALHHITVANG